MLYFSLQRGNHKTTPPIRSVFIAKGGYPMTVKFNVVQRGNPANQEAPKKFYPSIESSGRKTMRQLAGQISQISTVSSVDTWKPC